MSEPDASLKTEPAPLVSVLMPVFNAERYLTRAVESVLRQTCSDFELLAVDDGSRDSSPTLLARIARTDRRVVVVSLPHQGLVAALNHGVALARGVYLARMDADDVCLPERFARQAAYLENHREVVALGSWLRIVDAEGFPLHDEAWAVHHEEIDACLLLGKWGLPHPAAMIRADALRRVGGYRNDFPWAEDFDLWLRLGEIGRLENLPEILLEYRRHPSGVCSTHGAEQRASVLAALHDACRRRGLPFSTGLEVEAKPPPPAFQVHRAVAYRALHAGYQSTARKYAAAALRLRPSCWRSWLLLALASPLGTPFRAAARARIARRLSTAATREAA
jgi:GT2 family glycosyltransferase